MIQRFLFLAVSVVVTSCAVPRSHKDFSLSRPGLGDNQEEFVSSTDLRVAGLVSEGLSFANNGRMFNAEGRMRQAAFLEPSNDRIAFNLAVILNQSEQSAEALAILERLLAKEPQNPNYLQAAADVLVSEGRHEEAKSKLKEAFAILKAAKNSARAAVVARSISNIAFGVGSEQEALCYSYEALTLAPSAVQLGFHASTMVALNLYESASRFINEQVELDPARGSGSQVHFAHGLALGAVGQSEKSLQEVEVALDLLGDNPDIVPEVNAVWWLLKQGPVSAKLDANVLEPKILDPKVIEAEAQMKETFFSDVQRLKERPTYSLIRWPPQFREMLESAEQPARPSWWSLERST